MTGIHIPRGKQREMPDDFPDIAPKMTQTELRRYYHCGNSTISRWCTESGVEYKGHKPPGTVARKPKEYAVQESRAVIDACLNCPIHRCRGTCGRLEMVRARELAEKGDGRQSQIAKRRLWLLERYQDGYETAQLAEFSGLSYETIRNLIEGMPPSAVMSPLPPLESRKAEWDMLS